MATKEPREIRYVYNIHCLQKAKGVMGKGNHEGRTWTPSPGTFQTLEEAEAYCEKFSNEVTVYWWEKSLVGVLDLKKRKRKK